MSLAPTESIRSKELVADVELYPTKESLDSEEQLDARDRTDLERRLVRKLDLRMFILVIIYILNYVSPMSYALSLC